MNPLPLTPELLTSVGPERPLRIAVGWDQSGEEAVHFAGWLARTMPAQIRVVSTEKQPWSHLRNKTSKKYKKWRKEIEEKRSGAIREALKEHVPRGAWDEDYAVFRDGSPRYELLTQEVERFHADLVLVGSKPKAAKGRFKATSTADALMHSSPVSVGLAPRAVKLSKKGITRVNFAFLDENDEAANTGIASAAAIAMILDVDLRIMAFSPEETYDYNEQIAPHRAFIDEWNETSLALLDRARDVVSDMAEKLGVQGLKNFEVETRVSAGDGWDTVVDSQKWKKGDVLFLASRPATTNCVFAGPRTTDFLEHAPVPVVIFPQR